VLAKNIIQDALLYGGFCLAQVSARGDLGMISRMRKQNLCLALSLIAISIDVLVEESVWTDLRRGQ
jgi:hypothetical protein